MDGVIILLVSIMIYAYFYMKNKYDELYLKLNDIQKKNIVKKETINVVRDNQQLFDLNRDRDYRALADPLYPPLKRNHHFSEPSVNNMINIKTRGDGGPYQQIGSLYKTTNVNQDGTSPGSNNDSQVLPLFGKPTYNGSNNYNYYTVSNNNVKIPITLNNKDCSEDKGCKEIEDDSVIRLNEFNGDFKANIYNFDKPRYIPYVN